MIYGQFNDSFPPVLDGVANVAMNYARYLNEYYGKCYMVTPKNPKTAGTFPYEVLTFRSYSVPSRNEYRWGFGALDYQFMKRVYGIPFDIVHAHSPFSSGVIAKIVASRLGIPLVATLHSKYRDDFVSAIKSERLVDNVVVKHIARFLYSCDDVWTVNDASVKTLRDYGYEGSVFVLNNGCDIEPCLPCCEARSFVCGKFGLRQGTPILCFVGQHINQKNIPMLLEALKRLDDNRVPFQMLFVGDGPSREGYIGDAERKGLGGKVRFLGKIADRDLLKKIYQSSDLMLFPSLYDTSSLVPREAAACCCPTLFVEGSSTAQGIADGENGFLAKNDPCHYAAKIRIVLETAGLAEAAGRRAQETLYRPWKLSVNEAFERYRLLVDRKRFTRKQRKVQ